jgi:hypothetical protein
VLIFRRQAVEQPDILTALDEARSKAAGSQGALNIIRPE